MNVKKMSTEHLQEVIFIVRNLASEHKANLADLEFLSACEKELARRWGIKQ